MALKPGTIKALFGKLATNADDIAKYGGDVVDIASPYVDDVTEDTARLLNYYNTQSKWHNQPYMGKYVEHPVLQNALQGDTLYANSIPVADVPKDGVLTKAYNYVAKHGTDADFSKLDSKMTEALMAAPQPYSPEKTISAWGDAIYNDTDDLFSPPYLRGYNSVDAPELPANQLAFDWDEGDLTIRPHKGNRGMYALYQKLLNKG